MQSTLSRSTPQPAYWLSSESYQAWPAALSLMPQLVGSHGQASAVSAASVAWKAELAMGRLRSTEARGMPRTMWMPDLRPQLVGSDGQASAVSAASVAWKAELAMGRLRSTEARGMPRTMWMPNLRP